MKANELRIGNYILNEYDTPSKVREITHYECVFLGDNLLKQDLQNCNPVPLTEELLLKCGFNKKARRIVWDIGWIELWYSSYAKNYQVRFYKTGNDIEKVINIEYLHQLQNLYFAITGEELDVKL
jgi:hypothetical protein